jgi:hypothetical protein
MCRKQKRKQKIREMFIEFIFSFLGYFFIYYVSINGQISPIILTGIFTLIACITSSPKYIPFFLTSCLSGIMDNRILSNIGFIGVSAILIVILFRNLSKHLPNVGGVRGLYAFIANLINIGFQSLISLSGIYEYKINKFLIDLELYEHINIYMYIFGPIFSMVACLSVQLISNRIDKFIILSHRIMAYCIVTTFGTLFLITFKSVYYINSEGISVLYGNSFASCWNIGSLAGFTVKGKFHDYVKDFHFYHYLIVGYMSGWIHIGLIGFCHIGGRQGVIAFIANIVYIYILKLIFHKRIKTSKVEEKPIEYNKVIKITVDT